MKELLAYAKDLNKLDAMPDEVVDRIEARMKARELKQRIADVHTMSGEEIKAMRDRYGMSQSVLAHTLGMSKESVSKWERNEIKPSRPALRILNTISEKGPEVFIS